MKYSWLICLAAFACLFPAAASRAEEFGSGFHLDDPTSKTGPPIKQPDYWEYDAGDVGVYVFQFDVPSEANLFAAHPVSLTVGIHAVTPDRVTPPRPARVYIWNENDGEYQWFESVIPYQFWDFFVDFYEVSDVPITYNSSGRCYDNDFIVGSIMSDGRAGFEVRLKVEAFDTIPTYVFYGYIAIGYSNGVTITTTSLPDGVIGEYYYQQIQAAPGLAPYSWSVYDPATYLPLGLSIDPDTGVISGVPEMWGDYEPEVHVEDFGTSEDYQLYTLTVDVDSTVPSIDITDPTTGPSYVTTNPTIDLAGTASDNASVIGVEWANDRGGDGTCSGTTDWTQADIPLFAGTNTLTVTAEDYSGNRQDDTLSVLVPSTGLTYVLAVMADAQVGLPARQYSSVDFDREIIDMLGEYDPNSCVFTAKNSGRYLIELGLEIDDLDVGERMLPVILHNGAVAASSLWHADRNDTIVTGSTLAILGLEAGDTVSGQTFHNARDGAQNIRPQPWVYLKIARIPDSGTFVNAVMNSAQGGVPPNVFTPIRFDGETADALGEYDPTAGLFTAKNSGTYLVQLGAEIDDLDSNERLVPAIYKNKAVCSAALWHAERSDTVIVGQSTSILHLEAGDTIEGYVFHNARDGPQTIRNLPWCYLRVVRLPPGLTGVCANLANQQNNVPANTYTPINLDGETVDTRGEYSTESCTFTAQNAGAYAVQLGAEIDDLDYNERMVPVIYVNGQVAALSLWHSERNDSVIVGGLFAITFLCPGDTVRGYIFHNARDGAQRIRAQPWCLLNIFQLQTD